MEHFSKSIRLSTARGIPAAGERDPLLPLFDPRIARCYTYGICEQTAAETLRVCQSRITGQLPPKGI